MSVHFIDSVVFGDSVGTSDLRQIFSETTTYQRWLDVEVALAKAQADLGMIPEAAAQVIAAHADAKLIDLEAVKAHGKRTGHSLLGVLAEFRRLIAHDDARYVHFGATTQDIIDTGLMLMIKDAYRWVENRLAEVMRLVATLSEKHAGTVMVGRAHGGGTRFPSRSGSRPPSGSRSYPDSSNAGRGRATGSWSGTSPERSAPLPPGATRVSRCRSARWPCLDSMCPKPCGIARATGWPRR